jgi:hypothetical protein
MGRKPKNPGMHESGTPDSGMSDAAVRDRGGKRMRDDDRTEHRGPGSGIRDDHRRDSDMRDSDMRDRAIRDDHPVEDEDDLRRDDF